MDYGGGARANSPGTSVEPGTHVLVVEDEPVIGALVKQALEEAGWTVMVLSPVTPDLFRITVNRLEPACVLLDGAGCGDYGQSWLDAAWLRERARPVPALMFSADGAAVAEAWEGNSARSRAAGFAGIIEKPFDLEALEAAVARTVEGAAVSPVPTRM